jgi:translocation and assembly module TamA
MDHENAILLLHSLGHYEGEARFTLDDRADPAVVTLILRPGPVYAMGRSSVSYDPEPVVPDVFLQPGRAGASSPRRDRRESAPGPIFPRELRSPEPGRPALASTVLDATEALPPRLQRRGYPYARVLSSRYTLDREKRVLNADITLDPGPAATMGSPLFSGTERVRTAYLERLVSWREGTPWNANLLEYWRETLQQTGLFSLVDVGFPPLQEEDGGERPASEPIPLPVTVRLTESPPRSITASLRYATDVGAGLRAEWEHRNLFGSGELLRLKLPIAQDLQGFTADFTKPSFLRNRQTLLAGASLTREKTDAYRKSAAGAYIGLERRLGRYWWADVRLRGEKGSEEDYPGKNGYAFVGLQAGLRRDTRDNRADPRRGTRLAFSLAPYAGRRNGDFHALTIQAEGSIYHSPFAGDRLVLAGKWALGGTAAFSAGNIPAGLRFYSGGGGTVRGYPYQSLGPRRPGNDPQGGLSFQYINLEARIKVTESLGVVPFADGGMVYGERLPRFDRGLDWALGLGIRYFTVLGPVRLDVAFPLRHYPGDDSFQLYISIGQAF